MAIAVDSTTTDVENTSSSNKTLTYSTSCDVDDILYVGVIVNVSGGSATIGAPTTTAGTTDAWTEVAKINPSDSCGIGLWRTKVTAAGTTGVSQTTTRSGNNVGARGFMLEISGADTTTPAGSSDTHNAATDATASNSNLEIQGESGNLVIVLGGNWNASGNNSEDIDSGADGGYTAIFTGTNRYEASQCDYHAGWTILSANDTTTRGVLDQVSGTGDWVAAIAEVVVASGGGASVAGSQAAETDTANAGAAVVVKAGAQAAESDTANGGALRVALPGSQAAESDAASGGAAIVVVAGSQAAESDAARAGVGALALPGSLASTTETANGGVPVVVVAGSQASETDTANAGTFSSGGVFVNGSQAAETDTANAGSAVVVVAGSRATESDEARAGEAFMSQPGSGGGEEAGVTLVANRTTYRTTGPLAHQL